MVKEEVRAEEWVQTTSKLRKANAAANEFKNPYDNPHAFVTDASTAEYTCLKKELDDFQHTYLRP